jgi:hypothetical protein
MLSILVVGGEPPVGSAEPESSLEALHARDAEEAVEKLARNRRIDAVLILPPTEAAPVVQAIGEDLLAPPPIFLPAGSREVAGARVLGESGPDLARLLTLVARELEG